MGERAMKTNIANIAGMVDKLLYLHEESALLLIYRIVSARYHSLNQSGINLRFTVHFFVLQDMKHMPKAQQEEEAERSGQVM